LSIPTHPGTGSANIRGTVPGTSGIINNLIYELVSNYFNPCFLVLHQQKNAADDSHNAFSSKLIARLNQIFKH
jgi:hypothetical protein